MDSPGDGVVLRAPDAAARLGLDPKTLRRKLRAGEIPGYQIGTTWFVYMPDDQGTGARVLHGPAQPMNRASHGGMVAPSRARSGPTGNRPGISYESMANWSSWVPFVDACRVIPRLPGVYVARIVGGEIVYIGMAAERSGHGMRGRLAIYSSGKGATAGMGETALDLALADPAWMRERTLDAENGRPLRAKELARAAIHKADLELRWTTTADGPSASALELEIIQSFAGKPLWNRRR